MTQVDSLPCNLLNFEPVPALVSRLRSELRADFSGAFRVSRAPGRLDVMGGIADEAGGVVCQQSLDCAAAAATSARDDRLVQVFSFNQYDAGFPFTLGMSLDALADAGMESLRAEFNQPGRLWAGRIAGCLKMLHERGFVDLKHNSVRGLNIAVLSTIPSGAGLRAGAAVEAATLMNLLDHFGVSRDAVAPHIAAAMCVDVETRLIGSESRVSDQLACWLGEAGGLLRVDGANHEAPATIGLPEGVGFVAIDTGVRRPARLKRHERTRTAAKIAHRLILEKMRDLGDAAGKILTQDPMHGYLAHLDADDYRRFFRPYLPEEISGHAILAQFAGELELAQHIEAKKTYRVQQAADHFVLDSRRIRKFVDFLHKASALPGDSRPCVHLLNMAGHLMYASNIAYANDALIGSEECDLLISMIRRREQDGFFGARLTAIGSGGVVAVLCRRDERAGAALVEICGEFHSRTGSRPVVFSGTSPGAWIAGTRWVE